MRRLSAALPAVFCLAVFVTPPAPAEEAAKTDPVFHFPKDPYIAVDREKREIRLQAQFSPALTGIYGILEFLLVSGTYNKEDDRWYYERAYESLFITRANPANIHLALMMAKLMPGPLRKPAPQGLAADNSDRVTGKREEAANPAANAPMIDVIVEWTENGQPKSMRAETFLFDRERKANAADTPWAFTGSYLLTNDKGEKILAANQTCVAIAIFHDESALVNLPFFTLNPYRGDNQGLEMNANHLPPFFRQDKKIIEGTKEQTIQVPQAREVTLLLRPSALKEPEPDAALPGTPATAAPAAPAGETPKTPAP